MRTNQTKPFTDRQIDYRVDVIFNAIRSKDRVDGWHDGRYCHPQKPGRNEAYYGGYAAGKAQHLRYDN